MCYKKKVDDGERNTNSSPKTAMCNIFLKGKKKTPKTKIL